MNKGCILILFLPFLYAIVKSLRQHIVYVVEQCFSNFNGHINQLQILEKWHLISVNLSWGHNAAFLIQTPLGGDLKLLVLTPHFE